MSAIQAPRNGTVQHPASDADLGMLDVSAHLQEEMARLAAINHELLAKARPAPKQATPRAEGADELTGLRGENAQLRARVEELENALQAAVPSDEVWSERQKEFESLLEEKSEVIRALHLRIQEVQEAHACPSEANMSESQMVQKEVADQRRQLQEDEESLMQQMRQMEMAMAKDRAELARQRNEIQRLQNELNHEVEIASRDPGLRERLVALQRLQGEIGRKQSATPASTSPAPASKPSAPPAKPAPAANTRENSGILRRIFGK